MIELNYTPLSGEFLVTFVDAVLLVSRLHWLVEAGKANEAHAAILRELQESGSCDLWGVTNAAMLAHPAMS